MPPESSVIFPVVFLPVAGPLLSKKVLPFLGLKSGEEKIMGEVRLIALLCNESTQTDVVAADAEMSSGYSANQFDSAFRSQRLQNWCETKRFKERPTAQEGHTNFIADDRGHLLPGVVKRGSAWPDFKGTWDLPARIPGRHINPTGRSVEGLDRLKSWGFDPQHTGKSHPHRGSRNTGRLQDVGDQQDGASPSPGPEVTYENRPGTGEQRSASQNQDWQAGGDEEPEGRPASDVADTV